MSSLHVHCRRMMAGWLAFAVAAAAMAAAFAWHASETSGFTPVWSSVLAAAWSAEFLFNLARFERVRRIMRSPVFFLLIVEHHAQRHPHRRRRRSSAA